MAPPPTPQEGASQIQPPLFNGKYYGWWKNRMMDHLIGENPDLWSVVLDGPMIPMKKGPYGETMVPKERQERMPQINWQFKIMQNLRKF